MSDLAMSGLKMQQKIGLVNLYFNRFLAVRYSTALFLFLNLYWAVFLYYLSPFAAILPLFLFTLGICTALEQVKLYRNHCNKLPYAHFFYCILFVSNIFLLFIIYSPLYSFFYPFLKNTTEVINILTVLLLLTLLITFLMLIKLNKIKHNQDKHIKRIKTYEKIIN